MTCPIDEPSPATAAWLPEGAVVVLVFSLGYFVSYLYRGINISLAPSVMRDTGMDASTFGLVTSMYFLGFALAQVPAGVLLDRYGPRRTEASLLLLAAVGTLIFGAARSPALLMAARAMIGIGVSIYLAGAFKAIAGRFRPRQLPMLNGIVLSAGGLGGVLSGAPAVWIAGFADRWTVCLALAALSTLTAVALLAGPREPDDAGRRVSLSERLRGTRAVLSSRFFWRVAPFSVVSQGVFYALQSLWAGAYMQDASGLSASRAAGAITVIGLAQMVGSALVGSAARWLSGQGVGVVAFSGGCMALFMLDQIAVIAGLPVPSWLLWGVFGLVGPSGALTYAVLTEECPTAMAGRVNTTLTLLPFVAVFLFQYGIGFVVSLWPMHAGHHAAVGQRVAWSALVALQLAASLLYLSPRTRVR